MQNLMVVFIFSDLDWKYPFWANLVQKIKIVSSSWNLVPGLTQMCRIQWWCPIFQFLIGNTLLGKFDQKNKIDSLSWNSVWRFEYAEFNGGVHFFWFRLEIPFFGKLGPENYNCQFKLKFGTLTNSNMQNSVVIFTFSFFHRK